MNVPDKLFTDHSWLEITIYMFVKRNTKDGVVGVSLQRIADEFCTTKGKVRHIMDKLYGEKLLIRTTSARFSHGISSDSQRVTTVSRTKCARNAHDDDMLEQRSHDFGLKLVPYMETYGKPMIREFFDYWTERNKSGTRMRFEMENVFDIPKRLARWKLNNYNNNAQSNGTSQREEEERAKRLASYAEVAKYFSNQSEEDRRRRGIPEHEEGAPSEIPCQQFGDDNE